MVLANVAYILAWQISSPQSKILMIDWDLEAPGLPKLFSGQIRNTANLSPNNDSTTEALGLIDFLHDVKRIYESHESIGKLSIEFADTQLAEEVFEVALRKCPLSKYLVTIDPPRNVVLSGSSTQNLFLMSAGRQNSSIYLKRLEILTGLLFTKSTAVFLHSSASA
jgi:hypothetical protein